MNIYTTSPFNVVYELIWKKKLTVLYWMGEEIKNSGSGFFTSFFCVFLWLQGAEFSIGGEQ